MSATVTLTEKQFIDFFNTRIVNENIFNNDGSLNKSYNSSKKTGIIASIFEDQMRIKKFIKLLVAIMLI